MPLIISPLMPVPQVSYVTDNNKMLLICKPCIYNILCYSQVFLTK